MLQRAIAPTLLLAAFLSACGGSKERQPGVQSAAPAANVEARTQAPAGGQTGATANVRTSDLDNNGVPEVFKYYNTVDDPEKPGTKKTVLVRQDLDVTWDGKIDLWRYFGDDGQVTKEEWDTDYDGKVDEVRTFEAGVIVKSERDRNNDGKPDVVRFYKGGVLERKEVDGNNDGQPDRWEYYSGRVLDRVGVDKDHDGTVDTWAKADGSTAEAAAKP